MSWSAVWVKARHEKAVTRHLEAQGVTVFLPLHSVEHRWADRNKIVELPMIPNYVFCEFAPEQPVSIRHIPGVVDYVRCGAAIATVDGQEIDALKRTAASGCRVDPWPSLVTGQAAEIIAGPLTGLAGTVVEYRSHLRLVLSVTLLKSSVLVEIEPTSVRMTDVGAAVPKLAFAGEP